MWIKNWIELNWIIPSHFATLEFIVSVLWGTHRKGSWCCLAREREIWLDLRTSAICWTSTGYLFECTVWVKILKYVTWMILCGPPGCRKFLFEYWKTFHKWTYLTTKIYCPQLFMFFKTYFSHQFWSNILIFKPLLHPTSTFYWIKFQPLFAALFYIK